MSNDKIFEELTPDEMFNRIAVTISRLSPNEINEDESKKAARTIIGYMQVIYNCQLRKLIEESEMLKEEPTEPPKLTRPLEIEIPPELLAQQESKTPLFE